MAVTMPSRRPGQRVGRLLRRADRSGGLEAHVAQLEHYLGIQHEITEIIARSSELQTALPRIIQVICETTGWSFGEVWHVEREDDRLHCIATWCDPVSRLPIFEKSGWGMTFASGKGLPGRVWETGTPAWVTNVIFDANFMRGSIAAMEGLCGGLGIPIRTDGEIIGAMTFFSHQPRKPERDLLRMLDTVGSQIGLFMERKRIENVEREQSRALAAQEERQRLARDLHDSVTQTLFSASVIAEMLPILWERDTEQVKAHLGELHTLTCGALSEMRALLVELRPSAQVEGDLAELLTSLAESLRCRTNLGIALDVRLTGEFSADEKITLYRIAQEALNNICKHADAQQVSIRLCADAKTLELIIEDDGRGFDPTCVPIAHFGVQVMRERAETIGAVFILDSVPGKGTRLYIRREHALVA